MEMKELCKFGKGNEVRYIDIDQQNKRYFMFEHRCECEGKIDGMWCFNRDNCSLSVVSAVQLMRVYRFRSLAIFVLIIVAQQLNDQIICVCIIKLRWQCNNMRNYKHVYL